MSSAPGIHYPAQREPGESYATLEQILACSDLAEVDVRVDFWHADGRPALLRVRALDLAEQDKVRTAAARAVESADRERGVETHYPTFVVMTLALGITTPRVTLEQAQAFVRKNGRACELLVNLIWMLSGTSQERIDALFAKAARELAAATGSADDAADDPADPA